jgi:hypothetical protein
VGLNYVPYLGRLLRTMRLLGLLRDLTSNDVFSLMMAMKGKLNGQDE